MYSYSEKIDVNFNILGSAGFTDYTVYFTFKRDLLDATNKIVNLENTTFIQKFRDEVNKLNNNILVSSINKNKVTHIKYLNITPIIFEVEPLTNEYLCKYLCEKLYELIKEDEKTDFELFINELNIILESKNTFYEYNMKIK